MKDFGLHEFIELTGVGEGDYGIYRITRDGVKLHYSEDSALHDLAPKDQVAILKAEARLSLKFRCSPEQFQEWYYATRGENRVSDFSLAPDFLKALVDAHGPSGAQLGPSEPSAKIIAAFKVKNADRENRQWWDARMRSAKKYGLVSARASQGRAKQQSQWYPSLVAAWLIDKGHLDDAAVRRAITKQFPDADINLV